MGEMGWYSEGVFKKRGLDIRRVRRMVQDRSEWQRFVKGNVWGVAREVNP